MAERYRIVAGVNAYGELVYFVEQKTGSFRPRWIRGLLAYSSFEEAELAVFRLAGQATNEVLATYDEYGAKLGTGK